MSINIWNENIDIKTFPKLKKDIKTQICIIGGGIAGLLTARLLKDNGVDCIVLEAKKIASGTTKNTTAKITSQHGLIYSKLIKQIGKENAQKYLQANEIAIKNYSKLCKDIDCDFIELPNYVYSLNDRKKIEHEVECVNNLGGNAKFVDKIELPLNIKGAIKFNNQAQFNPLKFISHIVNDLNIYENTMVKSFNGNTTITTSGKVTADYIIIATHFPIINKHGLYFIKMYQQRSYVLALENAQNLNGMYIDEKENGLSFRQYKHYLLLGGGEHRTGSKGDGYIELRKKKIKLYPKSIEKYFWATQDCITPDSIPYIGQYYNSSKHLFVTTGFNKWGMTSSMVGAQILKDMILDKNNDYEEVFFPKRSFLNKKQIYINLLETSKNLLTPTTKRCSHLGCALKYNKQEHSWDCPCHGSRFSKDGHLIDNPAKRGINIK